MLILNKKIYINLILLWIFISSFYYAPNFISGDLVVERNSDLIHKSLKYIIALIFSLFYIFLWKSWSLILLYKLLLFYLLSAFVFLLLDYPSTHFFDTIVVLISFISFIYIGSKFNEKNRLDLSNCIIISALVLSSISFYEFFVGVDYLNDYWNRTGGYRSVSFLLNPNNLGFYLGASIIIVLINKSIRLIFKLIIIFPILFALILSGSRSSLLSLFIISSFFYIYGNNNFFLTRLIKYLSSLISFSLIIFLCVQVNFIELPYRFNNFYTFETRIDKYYLYFSGIELSYLYPDLTAERVELVSDNSFYHVINSLGLIPTVFLSIFLLFSFKKYLNFKITINFEKGYSFVVYYYLIGMFFDNILMSFPNNQLFFLAMGLGLTRSKEI